MKNSYPVHRLDAMLAALEAARAAWQDALARMSARRLAAHAAATGAVGANTDAAALESVDALIGQLHSARVSTEHTTILIVEDDRLTARILADTLAANERTVLVADSAAEATRLIREHDVGIILLDLVLPDGDGRDLLTQLRATPVTAAVPVLVISSHQDPITQAECFALGADTLLPKPVAPSVVAAAVAAHLGHAAERRLEGRVDGLTGLPNRAGFLDAMERALPLSRRNRQPLAVGMIDLDHFKSINDTYGHSVGDEVLRRTAQTIARALRTSDYVARWGGEELCVLLPDTTTQGAVRALGKALQAVRKLEFRSHDTRFGMTFSAGIAESLDEADRLMYIAKTTGRNRIISPADEADPPRPRALLGEADGAVTGLLVRLLESEGFSVAHCADGGAVAAAAAEEHFTIAIIGLNLPVMNGFDLVLKLRTMPTAAKLPIILLAASADEEDIVRGFDVGANDYVVKPFHARELLARINRLLPKR